MRHALKRLLRDEFAIEHTALHHSLGIVWLAATVATMFALAAGKHDTGRQLRNRVLQTESRVPH